VYILHTHTQKTTWVKGEEKKGETSTTKKEKDAAAVVFSLLLLFPFFFPCFGFHPFDFFSRLTICMWESVLLLPPPPPPPQREKG
jgi:hypothetical protein